MGQQLDRQRATGAQPFTASAVTVGQEPLIVDLLLPPTAYKHWIVEMASLRAALVTRGPTTAAGFPPNTGIFLCGPATPVETLAEATAGINLAARPFLIPLGPPGGNVATVGAGGFAFTFAMVTAPGFKFTVPYGFFLRAIVSCLQGSATPGPGTGSQGTFTALCYLEDDKEQPEGCN